MSDPLLKTPLHDLHLELGGKMVPFAGYSMPVQYPMGVLGEHNHTRAKAGLFDVSHMGQVTVPANDTTTAALEALTTADLAALGQGRTRYTLFTGSNGGILDDLMVTRLEDMFFIVVNAACKDADIKHLQEHLGNDTVRVADRSALLALQGPSAASVMAEIAPDSTRLAFMQAARMELAGHEAIVTRSGYTGEDGFEISVADTAADAVARKLLEHPDVEPIGLGARDSLRLEAGLCLYGHDISTDTTPVEAALEWAISKRRKTEGGFPGSEIVLKQLQTGATRRRVGIKPDGRAPAREGTSIADTNGTIIGHVTSGGFGPSVGGPVAMGYVEIGFAEPGTEIHLIIRDKPQPARVATLPFITPNYKRT